jgi:hypothetical protein
MKFWETEVDINARKVLVIPNITNSQNIEKDSFVDVIYNHILCTSSKQMILFSIEPIVHEKCHFKY